MNPFRYRPTDPDDDWSDNALSNVMAYVSPSRWCHDDAHWTAHLTEYLFTACPCCMLIRGIVVGAAVQAMLSFLILILIAAWMQ